jgi:endonuclease YncB( thermonuclease family)
MSITQLPDRGAENVKAPLDRADRDLVLRRFVCLLTAVTVVSALAGVPATVASAATAACLPSAGSPRCQVWTGKVAWVADGDTVLVDVKGDGTSRPRSIRLIGVQAMEQTVYSPVPGRRRGECHSLAATARVEQLVKAGGGVVRLTALHASSVSRGRPLRSMAVRINGVWRDIGQDLIRRGYALWLPFGGEWAWDGSYRVAQQRAAQNGSNMYDTDACGAGPYQRSKLSVWVNADADGADNQNLNGEWIRVGNASRYDAPVGGWWVRDSGLRRYTFPARTVVPARGAVYVHVGSGTDSATHKHWGLSSPIFENVDAGAHSLGDGAYLFDPQGDLRSWMQYPCLLSCHSRLEGKVELHVRYHNPEEIQVVNISTSPIDLFGHVLESSPYVYPFTESTVLPPGQALLLHTTTGTNKALVRYWGKAGSILNDSGDVVSLQTADDFTVACFSWGTGRC